MVWLGIALIIIGVGLIIGELFTGSGILLVSGIASLVFGMIILFTLGELSFQINWWLVGPLLVLFIAFTVFIIWRVLNTYHKKASTGKEDMVGSTAIVKRTLDPEGIVLFEGELWDAISTSGKILPEEEVIITKVDRLTLTVAKKEIQV